MLKFCFWVIQGCHALGKSQGNLNFLQGQGICKLHVLGKFGTVDKCQGI